MSRKHYGLFLALAGMVLSFSLFGEEENLISANGQYQQQAPKNGMQQNGMQQQQMMPMTQIQWMTDYQQAADKAKRENKYLLLFFTGSDWCGWCKKMDSEIFSDPTFAQAVGNRFVFLELDYPMNKMQTPELSQQNAALKQKFGVSGFPTIIILDSNQNFVAEAGYRSGGGQQFANYLMQLVSGR